MGRRPIGSEALRKGPWTVEEDEKLISYIQKNNGNGGSWGALPMHAGLNRCGKSCRLRWLNYLKPDIRHDPFTREEEEVIIKHHSDLGNQWSKIASSLPGRTDNAIKNHWNTHLRKKFLGAGVDPVTHKPTATDLNHLSNVNLPQLLSDPRNLGVLMNISNALMLQGLNAIDFSNPNALQNFYQILDTTSNPGFDDIANDGYNGLSNNMTYETLAENSTVPSMQSTLPEALTFEQKENNTNLTNNASTVISSLTECLFDDRDDTVPVDQESIDSWESYLLS